MVWVGAACDRPQEKLFDNNPPSLAGLTENECEE